MYFLRCTRSRVTLVEGSRHFPKSSKEQDRDANVSLCSDSLQEQLSHSEEFTTKQIVLAVYRHLPVTSKN